MSALSVPTFHLVHCELGFTELQSLQEVGLTLGVAAGMTFSGSSTVRFRCLEGSDETVYDLTPYTLIALLVLLRMTRGEEAEGDSRNIR